ncbi:MAG: hypothetical protein IJ079_07545 [Lachnospiraceae bacterium]|nr:hypothetical protein [Lachnospiraceae bacterium]
MACFIVPAAEAVITTVVTKVLESKEKSSEDSASHEVQASHGDTALTAPAHTGRTPFSHKLQWLNNMLWGGSALLAFEHIWHGEVVPWAPFLTAASDPASTAEMLHEMATTGVTMALLVTAVWLSMVAVSSAIERRSKTDNETQPADN